jgi:hypothetical protein
LFVIDTVDVFCSADFGRLCFYCHFRSIKN